MAQNLFPVFDVPAVLAEDMQIRQMYRPAPLWDIEKGDFATDAAGRIINGSGYDAWVLWCTKTVMTQRFAHYGYSTNAGIEAEEAFMAPDRKAQESVFERTITEALLADPAGRTRQVQGFRFGWDDGDSLHITCEVFGNDGNSATIDVGLKI